MSFKVTKDNIFFLLPESRYAVSDRIDGYMEEDFTLYVTAKLFPETLTEKESFMIARNGMHSGISAFKDSEGGAVTIMFTYWFKEDNGSVKPKQLTYILEENELNEFNEYIMICNHSSKVIECFFNKKLIGRIPYGRDVKQTYENAFYWFGCGSMIGPEEHRGFGDFEYKRAFVTNTKMNLEAIDEFNENLYTQYTEVIFNDLRKLKNNYPLKNNFAFLCDFNHHNRYKVWDLSFSGNYPQFYIEHNIYF
jgi:hypothetical protein